MDLAAHVTVGRDFREGDTWRNYGAPVWAVAKKELGRLH